MSELDNFRIKYPDYNDVDDTQLASMLATKYPDAYGDLIDKVSTKQASPDIVNKNTTGIGERVEKTGSFLSGMENPLTSFGDAVETGAKALATPAIVAGQVAGGIGDIVGAGVEGLYKAAVPEEAQAEVKKRLHYFSMTPVGKAGIYALEKGQEEFDKFEKKHPDAALFIGSSLNLFGLGVGTKGAKMTAKELIDIGSDISILSGKAMPNQIERQIKATTKRAVEKAIKPSVTKGKTAKITDQFYNKANNAIETIVEYKDTLGLTNKVGEPVSGLPRNLKQFSDAISNTKREIFKEYDTIAKLSGDSGASIDLSNIAKELDVIINDRGMTPDIIKYAQAQKDELINLSVFNPTEAQTRIQVLNNRVSSITDYNSAAKASVDSLVANKLRKSLNDVIENATGEPYKELKRKYGALSEIEQSVSKRAMQDSTKNTRGLIDYTSVFTGAEVVAGLATMNPSSIIKGGVGLGIKTGIKSKNNPNRIIKNMFNDVEKAIERGKSLDAPFKPKSSLIKKFNSLTKKQKEDVRILVDSGIDPEKAINKAVGGDYNKISGAKNDIGNATVPKELNVTKGQKQMLVDEPIMNKMDVAKTEFEAKRNKAIEKLRYSKKIEAERKLANKGSGLTEAKTPNAKSGEPPDFKEYIKLRDAEEPWKGMTIAEQNRTIDALGKEDAMYLSNKYLKDLKSQNEYTKSLIGSPLKFDREIKYTQTKIKQVETILRKAKKEWGGKTKQVLAMEDDLAKQKKRLAEIRRMEANKKASKGSPLTMPKKEFVKSPRAISIEDRLKGLK